MMQKNLAFVFFMAIFLVLCVQNGFADTKQSSSVSSQNSERTQKPLPAITPTEIFNREFGKAQKLVGQGEFKKARSIFKNLFRDTQFSKKQRKKVQRAYEDMNMKILFSDEESSATTTHVVKKGDSLYKIAKQYGTTIDAIKKINKLEKDMIYPDMKLKVLKGKLTIHVDKSANELALKLNDKTFKTYSVATGENNSTPTGDFKIKTKLTDPIWYKTGAVIQPGDPENSLGSRWLGFDSPGYGIHGTTEPETIGKQVSAGCVRMHNHDVEEIFELVPRGTIVTVVN